MSAKLYKKGEEEGEEEEEEEKEEEGIVAEA